MSGRRAWLPLLIDLSNLPTVNQTTIIIIIFAPMAVSHEPSGPCPQHHDDPLQPTTYVPLRASLPCVPWSIPSRKDSSTGTVTHGNCRSISPDSSQAAARIFTQSPLVVWWQRSPGLFHPSRTLHAQLVMRGPRI